MQTILRKTSEAASSAEEALALLRSLKFAKILHYSGNNVLAEIEGSDLPVLRRKLTGWIISPQGANASVPDTRIKARSA